MPRPKSFDPDTALARAMDVFWDKGYEGASVAELTDAMGINRFSLYDTFGDKHELYMKALARYEADTIDPLIARIDAVTTLDDVRALFSSLIDHAACQRGRPCCMVLRAAVAGTHDGPDACAKVGDIQSRIIDAYTHAIDRLRASGEINADTDPAHGAWSLFMLQTGVIVAAGTAPSADPLHAAVEHWIAAARA